MFASCFFCEEWMTLKREDSDYGVLGDGRCMLTVVVGQRLRPALVGEVIVVAYVMVEVIAVAR